MYGFYGYHGLLLSRLYGYRDNRYGYRDNRK